MKKLIAVYLFIGLLFGARYSNAQTSNTTTLSLQDCINIALEKSTAVLKGNNNIALAGTQVLAAYGQFLPDLSAGAGYNYDRGNNFYSSVGPEVVNQDRSAFNYQLTSSINIFNGYYNYSNWKAAKLNKQISDLTLDRAKQQISLDITQSYLQVILDQKLVNLDSSNLATSMKREDQLTMLNAVGRKPKTDLYQQQAQTSNDKLTLINAESRLRNDKILLFQKLRIDSSENYTIADTHIDDNEDAAHYANKDVLVQEALKDRVDLQSSELNTNMADWNIKKFRSGYLPKVSFAAGVYNNGAYFNTLNVNGANEMPVTQQSIPYQLGNYTYGLVGINAVWNIFDKNITRSNVQAAKIYADNARIDLQDTKISVETDVKQAHNDYINAVQQMETVGKGLVAAQMAYDAVNAQYKEGVTDFITETNAQQVLLQAQQNQVQASINMMLQKKVLDYAVGTY
ncbi:MAG TPA: TolC family protein [Flavipsychrobacter sp.]|nr:TolC family protein [Flavipsychrobacter sp.]